VTQTTRVVTRDGLGVRVIRTAHVEVTGGADRGLRAAVATPLWRVGTHASNDLILRDDTVSKHHLELALVHEGWRIRDLGSSNGTTLGGVAVCDVVVHDDVTLRLGDTTLQLRLNTGESELAAAQTTTFGSVVGRSPVMREMFDQLAAIAASDVSLLIEGETGVGKEILAESVHGQSLRKQGPFVVVDCAALAGNLFESELFGHVKGAFSGAYADRIGLLEAANCGTLFLDEVGELPRPRQVNLLGALERRFVRRVGDSVTRPLDVRIIAATHRDLARAVNDGLFRADLFYRIAVVRLRVPPLRERVEDIPLLAERFAGAKLSALAVARLAGRPWPGNVRELRNAVERAIMEASTALAEREKAPSRGPLFAERSAALARFEADYLRAALSAASGNLSAVCRLTRLDRRYLYRLLDRHGLRPR